MNGRRNKSDVHGFRLNNWVDVVSFTKMLKILDLESHMGLAWLKAGQDPWFFLASFQSILFTSGSFHMSTSLASPEIWGSGRN